MDIYCSSYCNHGHDKKDGKPVGHECIIIPPRSLLAESLGDYKLAIYVLQTSRRRVHKGKRAPKGPEVVKVPT